MICPYDGRPCGIVGGECKWICPVHDEPPPPILLDAIQKTMARIAAVFAGVKPVKVRLRRQQ